MRAAVVPGSGKLRSAVGIVLLLGVLGFPTRGPAACRPLGSQLECTGGEAQLVIGTQLFEPVDVGGWRPPSFQRAVRFPDDRPTALPFRVELQNFGAPPDCQKVGNETYCH
jgi:hypothetical protein